MARRFVRVVFWVEKQNDAYAKNRIVFVACAGTTSRTQLKEAYELLKKCNPNILGTVMTYRNQGKLSLRYGGYYHTTYYRNLKNHYMQEK